MEHTFSHPQLRLRVFAGPNGSGKSTVIKSIGNTVVNGKPLFLGTYINADDIAVAIKNNTFTFLDYELECSKEDILTFANTSGLLMGEFDHDQLDNCFHIKGNRIVLNQAQYFERLSQIVARLLREKLLEAKRRKSWRREGLG